MVEAFYREGKQILLLSYTNRAVDEISKALASIEPEIDFIQRSIELGRALPQQQITPSLDTGIATAPDDFSRIIQKAQAARDYFLLIGLGRKRGNRTDKNKATGNALLHLPPSGTRFKHILNQIRAE